MKIKEKKTLIPILFLILIVFFPTYLISENITISQGVLFIFFPLALCAFQLFKKIIIYPDPVITVFFICTLYFFISSATKINILNEWIFVTHFRYIFYFLTFILTYSIFNSYSISINSFYKSLTVVYFFIFLFIIIQILIPQSYFESLFSKKPAFDYTGYRIGGPFEWSYILAFTILPIFMMNLHNIIYNKKYDFINLFIIITSLIFIILSQSKSAYLALFLSILIYFIFCSIRSIKALITFVILTFILLLLSYFLFDNITTDDFSHINNFINNANNGSIDGSTLNRINQIKKALILLENNFLFGYPSADMVIENSYFFYAYFYGLIGLLTYLFLFSFLLFISFRNMKKYFTHPSLNTLSVGIFFLTFSVFIFGASASPTDANKASYYFYFLWGAYVSIIKRNELLN
ncbi:O-antigen ligase family protein [Moellerella wisconsensis]|uniref:O-antigen ligase family protein n=1 Tax=Moellerella wisconsensis TaxID=158849 RepID=UPI003075F9EB